MTTQRPIIIYFKDGSKDITVRVGNESARQAVKNHCKANGYKFSDVKRWEEK